MPKRASRATFLTVAALLVSCIQFGCRLGSGVIEGLPDGSAPADIPDGSEPLLDDGDQDACVPSCGNHKCGLDPVCQVLSCGVCSGSTPRCREGACVADVPPIQGTFLDVGWFTSAGSTASEKDQLIVSLLSEIEGLGMKTIIPFATRESYAVDPNTGAISFRWGYSLAQLETLLQEADARGMEVYVGLVVNQFMMSTYYDDPAKTQIVADTARTVQEILNSCGVHASQKGWYIPDEPALTCWTNPAWTHDYYKKLVAEIRIRSQLPVLISPFLGCGTTPRSPAETAVVAESFLENTNIDILAWQDSVGTQSMNLGWDLSRPTVGDYFSAIAGTAGIGKEKTWVDAELFTYNLFRPTSIARLRAQLEQSGPHVSRTVIWLHETNMSAIAPFHQKEAPRLQAAYRALAGLSGKQIKPAGHTWITAPELEYPDSGNELFDDLVGNPRDYAHAGWVGVAADAEIEIDLGSTITVDWFGVVLLQQSNNSISFPGSLEIRASLDRAGWDDVGKWEVGGLTKDGEYVLSNPEALGLNTRFLKLKLIRLNNANRIFLSEIELIAD